MWGARGGKGEWIIMWLMILNDVDDDIAANDDDSDDDGDDDDGA